MLAFESICKGNTNSFVFSLFFIVVQEQLSPFSLNHALPPPHPLHHPSPPPTLQPTPFGFVHVSFIHIPWWPFSLYPPLSLSPLLSGYCKFCSLFQFLWLYFACLFVSLIRFNYRWDHMVFVFHSLAYFTYYAWHNSLKFHPCCCEGRIYFLSVV